jgi:hypothetical protein
MESKTNRSIVPLNVGGLFLGDYDNIILYSSAVISIVSDTINEITAYQTLDKKTLSPIVFNYDNVNELVSFTISPLKQTYLYFTVRNNSNANQTLLNFSVSYNTAAFESYKGVTKNLWGGTTSYSSSSINLSNNKVQNITAFGNVNAGCVLTLQQSVDGSNWFNTQYSYTLNSAGNFSISANMTPLYVRLNSDTPITGSVYFSFS